mgnify:CR=1 FL=1
MKTLTIISGLLVAGSALGAVAPYDWTGVAADGDFFNEANWTDGGGPFVDDIFVAGGGMLGGAGAYNITGADFSGSGFGEVTGGVLWDSGAVVTFTNTTGRFQGVFRSQQTGSLTFDNSDLSTGALAEWNTVGEFNAQSGPFSNQWTGFLVHDSDVLATNNGTDPNQGVFFGNVTISDTSSLSVQSLSNSYVTLDGAGSQLTINGGGNPINQSIVNLDAVGASIRFLGESVDAVLAEHLYANSADQPEGGVLIGGQLAGNAGMTAGDLDGSGNFTNANGVGFNLVTDGASGSILTVTTLPSAGDALTYTNASGYWDRNFGTDWDNGLTDVVFFEGDIVTFDDSATGFPGTINVLIDGNVGGPVQPGEIIVNNSVGNDYVFDMVTQASELFGNAPLTKSGDGTLTFAALDGDTPYGGEITINGGVVELANQTGALRNAAVTVNPGTTFRVLNTSTGQEFRNPDLTLAGGTLDIEDRSFYYNAITLAPGTTSTINTDEELFTWAGPTDTELTGSGNLVKTGSDFFRLSGRSVNYTGTTSILEGDYIINANRTAESSAWMIEGGSLELIDDSGAPIENLIGAPPVSLTGGTFTLVSNTETIGDLSMDSTSDVTTLEIDPATTNLTVANLDLTGTLNTAVFNPAITTSGTYNVLTYTGTLTGTLGTNLVLPQYRDSQVTWNDVGGVVTVTLDLSAPGLDLTYTGVSGTNVWDTGLTADWDDSGSPEQFFLGDNVTFDDSADASFSGTLELVGSPVPTSVTFNNSVAQGYTLTGGGIAGTTGLTKTNDGTVVLQNLNTYTGDTIVSGGTLILDGGTETLGDLTEVTISNGAVLQLNRTNAITRINLADAGITVDGSTLEFTETGAVGTNTHAHLPTLTLRDGALVTATSGGGFANVNADFDGDVIVEGTTPSTIGPFNLGFRFSTYGPTFDVADVTSDSAVDLTVDSRISGSQGFTKTGVGTMFIAANPLNDTDYTTTTVNEGCLLVEDLSAIPADLTQVSVGAGACFGGAAGASNLTDVDLESIAANVAWDAGGDARLLIDTAGGTVTVAADLAGNFKIVAAGGGTLDLTGTLAVHDIIAIDGTTVNTGSAAATVISIESIVTTPDGANTDVTLTFDADGEVDIYGTDDFSSWTKLNVSPVAGGDDATYTVEDLADTKQFFVIVSAGEVFPAAP